MDNLTPSAIADRIDALLKRFGRSKAEALRVTGIADHTIKNLRKDRWPQIDTLLDTARRLEVDLYELLEPAGERKTDIASIVDAERLRRALRITRQLMRRGGYDTQPEADRLESIAAAEIYRHSLSLERLGRSAEEIESELSAVAETAVRISSEFLDR